jgi:phospholipid/cholesterol/gamma-HCH transport system ATP-binding protein
MREIIKLEGVVHSPGGAILLNGINLTVKDGDVLMITGSGGSGKSTLLEICAGLIKPSLGTVFWNGYDIWKMSPAQRLSARKSTGFLFQNNALISNLTVADNISLPLRYHTGLNTWEASEKALERMNAMGLADVAGKRPEELSSEQSRWAALARALIIEPEILFLDAPTAGIDPVAGQKILHLLLAETKRRTMTIIVVSHSLSVARTLGCPVAVLNEGKLSTSDGTMNGGL